MRSWSRSTLEKAGEKVMDVPGDDDDDNELGESANDGSGTTK